MFAKCVPFALPERPAGNDPERDHEYEQHRSWTNGHEGFEDEPRVEVDAVERAYAPAARVREQLRVEEHHPERERKSNKSIISTH